MAGFFVQVARFVRCTNDTFHRQPCPEKYSRENALSDTPFRDCVFTGMTPRTGFALSTRRGERS